MGAHFTQYTAELEAGGSLGPAPQGCQRFVYVLSGEITLKIPGKKHKLGIDGYAYLPPKALHNVSAAAASRLAVIEKPYVANGKLRPPAAFVGHESTIAAQPLMGHVSIGDDMLGVRSLLPAAPAFDCAVNTMIYQPGASLPMVEAHVMEHGLLMLEGGGIYRLGGNWYPVTAGDFIWMGPYCPQWFCAVGRTPAKYLIYKDWNRHPLA